MARMKKKRKSTKRPTAKQIAWRKEFAKRYGKKKRTKKNPTAKKSPLRAKKAYSSLRKAQGSKKPLTYASLPGASSPRRAKNVSGGKLKRVKSAGSLKPLVKRNPAVKRRHKFIIKAVEPTKTGYDYHYLKGDVFVPYAVEATKYATREACEKKMHEIVDRLPKAISSIRCMKVPA